MKCNLNVESVNALVEPAHHVAALPLGRVHPGGSGEALQGKKFLEN